MVSEQTLAGDGGEKAAVKEEAMNRKPKILVVGSFVMDQIATTTVFPREGQTVLGGTFSKAPGGKGANQAVQMARLGADVTMAQGLRRAEPDRLAVAFIGDSTFFASGITGVINAVYNETDLLLIVLDNSTTAMTGHQPHPGTGITMMGHRKPGLSIEAVLTAVGVGHVATVNPLSLAEAVQAVRDAADLTGVRAVVFRSPCIAVAKGTGTFVVTDRCIHCRKCVTELGCPAIAAQGGEVVIEPSLCFGCGLCAQVCPVKAIERGEVEA